MENNIDYNLHHREIRATMDQEEPEFTTDTQPPPWIERVIYLLLPYLHLKRHVRVIYFIVVGSFLSLLKAGGEFFHLDILTGKNSFLNMIFFKFGMGWTLIIVILLRVCCLPLHFNWKEHLWNLILRISSVTFFFYLWCQVVFPVVEEWTGRCVKQNIVVNAVQMNKKRCLRLEDHEFYAFDISGHSFLMPYGIFTIMEESKELIYVLCLGQFLRRPSHSSSSFNSKEEAKASVASSLSVKELSFLQKKYAMVVPCVLVAALLAVCLSLLWDFSFLITTFCYHTLAEKFLGLSIAIATWYLEYPLLLTSLDVL